MTWPFALKLALALVLVVVMCELHVYTRLHLQRWLLSNRRDSCVNMERAHLSRAAEFASTAKGERHRELAEVYRGLAATYSRKLKTVERALKMLEAGDV